jgi:hypothetical protein
MPRSHEVQSGPEDSADAVCYSDGELVSRSAAEESDSDYERDSEAAAQQSKKSSSSQQVNHIRQSTSNAQAAAALAASGAAVPAASSPSTAEQEIAALKKELQKQKSKQAKRELEIDDKLHAILQQFASSKRPKAGKSSKHKKAEDSSSSDDGNESDSDNSNGNGGKSNSPSNGKQDTLRKQALLKFENFSHVDIRVFLDKNITVRKEKELVSIEYVQGFIAAWSAFNAELQQYLLRNNRVADALMVTNYYNQLIGLLTEYNTQWKQIIELDDWIRGERFKVNDQVVWDFHHRNTTLNNRLHRIQLAHLSGQRHFVLSTLQERAQRKNAGGAHSIALSNNSNTRRRDNKSVSVCYAYNGEKSIGEWTSTNYCRGADQCRFAHKCAQCYGDHAMYDNSVCAAKPKDGIRAASRHK